MLTDGDVDDLRVGRNAVFYDRDGVDWDATVTKIVDNPISVRQAFWAPYKKVGRWISDKINKSASEKNDKSLADLTATADNATNAPADGKPAAPKSAFDIAKFAGIFAAIGMALGMIGTMLVSVAKGWVTLTWWQQILVFCGILLLISGPSMVMAWLKLRRRNLAPVLNANGWAVNADAIISVIFGRTLTEQVAFPLVKAPKLEGAMSAWKKWVIGICVTLLVLAVICVVLHLCGFCCCFCCR